MNRTILAVLFSLVLVIMGAYLVMVIWRFVGMIMLLAAGFIAGWSTRRLIRG